MSRWYGLHDEPAKAQAYARLKNISIPNMYCRDDMGNRWVDDSDRLHNGGYLR